MQIVRALALNCLCKEDGIREGAAERFDDDFMVPFLGGEVPRAVRTLWRSGGARRGGLTSKMAKEYLLLIVSTESPPSETAQRLIDISEILFHLITRFIYFWAIIMRATPRFHPPRTLPVRRLMVVLLKVTRN